MKKNIAYNKEIWSSSTVYIKYTENFLLEIWNDSFLLKMNWTFTFVFHLSLMKTIHRSL